MHRMFFLGAVLLLGGVALSQDCTTSIVVNVFDDRLHVDVQTLTADDFQAHVGDMPITVVNSQQDYNSRLLVLVEVDGTAKNEKLRDRVEQMTLLAKEAPEGKPVAFGMYADKAIITEDFITDPKKRARQIDSVVEDARSLGKRVALFDALHQALQLFGPHQPGDTILLVGSPYDDKSDHSLSEVEKEFLTTGTRLMAMVREGMSRVGRPDFMLNTHEREKSLFLDFAEQTGGAHSEFDPRFFGFAWRGYMLDLKMSDRLRKPHSWSLRVRGLKEGFFKHTVIFYPQVLQPCRVTEAARAKGN
jgi:hypothetical protein